MAVSGHLRGRLPGTGVQAPHRLPGTDPGPRAARRAGGEALTTRLDPVTAAGGSYRVPRDPPLSPVARPCHLLGYGYHSVFASIVRRPGMLTDLQ